MTSAQLKDDVTLQGFRDMEELVVYRLPALTLALEIALRGLREEAGGMPPSTDDMNALLRLTEVVRDDATTVAKVFEETWERCLAERRGQRLGTEDDGSGED